MAVYLIRPEMTQSRQAFNHELDTKYTTQVPPPADFRPAKPFPTASSTAPSRPSDHLANAVTSNVAAGGRRQHAHYGSGDLEKGSLGLEQYQLEAAKHPQVAEAPAPLRILHHVRTDGRSANGNHTISTYDYEGYEHDGVEGKAMRVLIYLSLISPFVTCVLSIYSLLIQLFLILTLPLRLCTSRRTFSQQIIQHLGPPLQLQLRLIYSSDQQSGGDYSASSLSSTLVLSPVVSVGVAVAAWVAAIFWFYAAILGDPDGKGEGNDGRATVLSVRGWWEAWLERPFRR